MLPEWPLLSRQGTWSLRKSRAASYGELSSLPIGPLMPRRHNSLRMNFRALSYSEKYETC